MPLAPLLALGVATILCQLKGALGTTDIRDTEALRHLHKASSWDQSNCLEGSQWSNASSDPCDDAWVGLQFMNGSLGCSGQEGQAGRRVISIHLYECNLIGRLDVILPLVGNGLSRLVFLNLGSNQLSGSIPESLGQLSQLTELNLVSNLLSGSIPDSLGQLIQLRVLFLGSNQLSGSIPESLGQLSQLAELVLVTNHLSGSIPGSIGRLSQLIKLDLVDNHLSGTIPESIWQLTQLRLLAVGQNQLSGAISEKLGLLTQLRALGLNANQLSGSIPDSLGQLEHLVQLSLGKNQLSGRIPESLGQLSQLFELDLDGNRLSGEIPVSFGQMALLQEVYLNDNRLSGCIPESLGNLSQLTLLHMENNQLRGHIPSSFSKLSQLRMLNVQSNRLSGSIPNGLGQLTQLVTLALDFNQLEGRIPDSLGSLVGCRQLLLDNNLLSGPIPSGVLALPSLQVLDVAHNYLSGPLAAVRNATTLVDLNFANNSGLYIPAGVQAAEWFGSSLFQLAAASLQGVRLPHGFLGSLPLLPNLALFNINSTGVSGSLDANISSQLPSLVTLIMQGNAITGPAPPLPLGLRALVAFNNDFTHLPPLRPLRNLTYLVLDGNRHMAGQLHDDWSGFQNLKVLSLQHCSISGDIPPSLLQLSLKGQLATLGLRDNLLQGPIQLTGASGATSVSSLTGIDVGMNGIDGSIPAEMYEYIALAPALSVLRLDHNLLSCGLEGFQTLSNSSLAASILPGNSFQCPVPHDVAAADPAAQSYTCDSAPWQLDLVLTCAAVLCLVTMAIIFNVQLLSVSIPIALLLTACGASLLHWGVLRPSVYECAGGLWGSGMYHRSTSGVLIFVSLLALAMVPAQGIKTVPCLQPGTAPKPGEHRPAAEPSRTKKCITVPWMSLYYTTLLMIGLLCAFSIVHLGLDLLLVVLAADAWGIRGWLQIPHVMTVATLGTSLIKLGISAFIIPAVVGRAFSHTSSGLRARSTFMALLQVTLATAVPLLVALAQLQECFAYWMPWNTPTLLPVEYEFEACIRFCTPGYVNPSCQTRAGVPNCGSTLLTVGSATIDAPPLWRGTCSSSAYALFAPQAALMLAIQAIQVLAVATIQWRSQRTIGELKVAAQRATMQHARRKGCCVFCYRAPAQREAWLPQRGERAGSTGRVHEQGGTRPRGHSVLNPLAGATNDNLEMVKIQSPGESHPAPAHVTVRHLSQASDDRHRAHTHPAAALQDNSVCSSPGTRFAYTSPNNTFDGIQAHITLLVGGVFGAVYPAACLSAAAAIGAFAVSWRLAPHAQRYDAPVPNWLSGAMLAVYTASVWFAYGPGSMLEGASADTALAALVCLTVISCAYMGYSAAPNCIKLRCREGIQMVRSWLVALGREGCGSGQGARPAATN